MASPPPSLFMDCVIYGLHLLGRNITTGNPKQTCLNDVSVAKLQALIEYLVVGSYRAEKTVSAPKHVTDGLS